MAARTRTAKPRAATVEDTPTPPPAQRAEARRRDRAASESRAAVAAAHDAAENAVSAAVAGMTSDAN